MELSLRAVVIIIVILMMVVGLYSVSTSVIGGAGKNATGAGSDYNTVFECATQTDKSFSECQKTVKMSPGEDRYQPERAGV